MQDAHGFVVEAPKPALMPQHPAQPPPALPAPDHGDASRRATVNYSPPQQVPVRPQQQGVPAAANRVAAPISAVPAAATYNPQPVAPPQQAPPIGLHVLAEDMEYYDHDLPDA